VNSAPISRLSWVLAGVGAALGSAIVYGLPDRLVDIAYLFAACQVVVCLAISARYNKPDRVLWPALFILAVALVSAQIWDPLVDATDQLQVVPESLYLLVQVTLAIGLLFIIRRRIGNDPISVLGDGLIAALGSWFLIWVLLLRPTLESSNASVAVTAIQGATLATSAIVLF
jgi:hypothetical protein